MAGITGSALWLSFGGVELDTDFRDFGVDEEIGLVDQSAGSDANRTYLTTLKDGTSTSSIVFQSDNTQVWDAIVPGTEGTLKWAPEGTAANNVKHYVNAIVSNRSQALPYADLVVIDVSWQYSGAVTDTTCAA